MAITQTDMPLEQLREYRPTVTEPADFDAFWEGTLSAARAQRQPLRRTRSDRQIRAFTVVDLEFSGFAGDRIRAWGIFPPATRPLPTIVEFVGYGGGRGLPWEHLQWPAAGFAHIVMDTRGQGSVWGGGGDTPDPHGAGPAVPGFLTRGITDRNSYYYRRLFTDAVLLIDEVAQLAEVDPQRLIVRGSSQGGGVALAAAALNQQVTAVQAEVPFLCHFARSVAATPAPPITEITRYLSIHRSQQEQVLQVLSYFDGVNFAARIRQPTRLAAALMDEVVLPSTVFAAYHHLAAADREIVVFPYNGHEGGGAEDWPQQLAWLQQRQQIDSD